MGVNIGDLLGASLNGVERLLQQPGGCGEQKMLRIGPLVYMTEYLSATNSLTADFEAKYKNLVLQGETLFFYSCRRVGLPFV